MLISTKTLQQRPWRTQAKSPPYGMHWPQVLNHQRNASVSEPLPLCVTEGFPLPYQTTRTFKHDTTDPQDKRKHECSCFSFSCRIIRNNCTISQHRQICGCLRGFPHINADFMHCKRIFNLQPKSCHKMAVYWYQYQDYYYKYQPINILYYLNFYYCFINT